MLLSAARLVTLTGVGGVGKSRLALQVARERRRAFADGVWLVELADLRDPALVAHTMCTSLGVEDDTGHGSQIEVLTNYLRDRHVMVVLDNCEHLIEACANVVNDLLRAAPGLRVLATSRERLGLDGEHLWQVPPLPVPDAQQLLTSDTVLDNPALTLFAHRAAAVEPGFTVTASNQQCVSQICRLLDGIPLAIELAAVRLRVLSLEHLLSALEDSCRLLTKGRRVGAPRHQTLRAAIEWSFQLCSPPEQRLWARAAVFAGGFDLAAAQYVCQGDGLPVTAITDLVTGLVDKSVLVCERHGGETRFRLLDTIRQYGMNQLRELGEESALRHRHRDYYLRFAQQCERAWFGPDQPGIFTSTRLEHANLRQALVFSLSTETEARTGLRLAGTLWFYWSGCGALREGRVWLDRALGLVRAPCRDRAKALWVNGYVSTLCGDLTAATAMLEECRDYARRAGDDLALAYSTHRLGCTQLVGDDPAVARSLFEEAERLYARVGEMNSNVMLAWIELAIAMVFLGDLDRAALLCERARAVGEANGEQWAYAYAIYVLGLVASSRGDFDLAVRHARHCLEIKRAFHDLLGIVLAIELLAWTAAAQGQARRAAALLGAATTIWRSVGYPMFGSTSFGAPRRDCEQRARAVLGDGAFDAELRRGTELSLDDTVSYALGERSRSSNEETAESEEPNPLTRREQQVVALVAEGRSNKEIAAALVIAQRTAEGHVERVLTKLGFTSRVQIAAWATKRQQ